jgi:hypothetical protein
MGLLREAMLAFYIPITVLAGIALYLYTKALLWPAFKARKLTIKEHGLSLALAAGFFGDLVENTYYGVMRVYNSYQNVPHFTVQPVIGIKIAVLATSVIALAAYGSIVKGKDTLTFWLGMAMLLWSASFLVLYIF